MPGDLHVSPDLEASPADVPTTGPPTREEIVAHLSTVLGGAEFRASKRCQEFLRYVVEHALACPGQPLKERTIGIEALGRPLDYDTNADGAVRIKASEVRRRLQLHYANSQASGVHIALPAGSYIPIFSRTPIVAAQQYALVNQPVESPIEAPHRTLASRHGKALLLVSMTALIIAAATLWRVHASATVSILHQFWQPVVGSASPILVATDYAPVYLPPPNTEVGTPATTYTLLKDQYVGGGDLIAAVKIASLLTGFGHPYVLRMGTAVSFDDLRNTPTILIGYSSTQWSEVTRNFRYYIDDGDLGMIRDNGRETDWYPHNRGADYHLTEDYALISRAFDPQTHSMLVLISGCTQYGTEGAARLVTDADLLTAALHGAPADWAQKNLQLILRVDLVANAPATAKVIASYYW